MAMCGKKIMRRRRTEILLRHGLDGRRVLLAHQTDACVVWNDEWGQGTRVVQRRRVVHASLCNGVVENFFPLCVVVML